MKKLQEVNNQATINQSDFTITDNGEAFISQTRAAQLLGLPKTTLHDWIHRNPNALNLNKKSQLDHKSFQKAVLSERDKGNTQAIELFDKIMEGGAKAFIYHEAGFTMHAEQTPIPLTRIEQAELQLVLVKEIDAKEKALERVKKAFATTRSKLGGTTKANNSLKLALGLSENYIPVITMRKKFPTMKFNGKTLSIKAKELGEDVKTVSSLYASIIRNQYSIKTWMATYPEIQRILDES